MSEARVISPRVTMIPATRERFTSMPIHNARKRRVAAYARVSTRDEEQRNSYEAQVDHYTRYIQNNAEWEFAGVYADRGITGTSTKKREHFNDMIEDALAGKIDLIITKSVSRFARNTVDSLTTIRTLKERGIEVFFEEQNIYTLDSKGELLSDDHVIAGAGGEPEYLRERHMGHPQALFGWQNHAALQALSRLSQG